MIKEKLKKMHRAVFIIILTSMLLSIINAEKIDVNVTESVSNSTESFLTSYGTDITITEVENLTSEIITISTVNVTEFDNVTSCDVNTTDCVLPTTTKMPTGKEETVVNGTKILPTVFKLSQEIEEQSKKHICSCDLQVCT